MTSIGSSGNPVRVEDRVTFNNPTISIYARGTITMMVVWRSGISNGLPVVEGLSVLGSIRQDWSFYPQRVTRRLIMNTVLFSRVRRILGIAKLTWLNQRHRQESLQAVARIGDLPRPVNLARPLRNNVYPVPRLHQGQPHRPSGNQNLNIKVRQDQAMDHTTHFYRRIKPEAGPLIIRRRRLPPRRLNHSQVPINQSPLFHLPTTRVSPVSRVTTHRNRRGFTPSQRRHRSNQRTSMQRTIYNIGHRSANTPRHLRISRHGQVIVHLTSMNPTNYLIRRRFNKL